MAPLLFVQGVLLNFLYSCQHECYHRTAFRPRWLNDWIGRVCGFLVIYPFDYDKWQHFDHHRYTQDWEKDPELILRKPIDSVRNHLFLMSGIYEFSLMLPYMVRHAWAEHR